MPKILPRILPLALLCSLSTLPAPAQTPVVNPRVVEFEPSTDHAAVTSGGSVPMISRYDLQLFLQGASQPITTTSLGKPAPDPDGKIRVDFSTLLIGWPLANGRYEARVSAVGPTGAGHSDPSNLFDFVAALPPSCAFSLSSGSAALPAGGGSASVGVAATGGACGWSATTTAAWLIITPASGAGTGSVTVTASANTGSPRTDTVTIGGQPLAVTQAAQSACTFTVAPTSLSLTAAAFTSTVGLTASAPTCPWTAGTATSWITLPRAGGTGSAAVGYSVAKNGTSAPRVGTFAVGGQVVTLTQAAASRPTPPRGVKLTAR